jgi:hypothetical protein
LTHDCPGNTVVKGIKGTYDAYVNRLALRCRPFAQSGQTTYISFLGSEPGNHSFSLQNCPDGKPARGFHGKAGSYIDSVGLICHTDSTPLSVTYITYNVPFWVGSTPSSFTVKASAYTARGGSSRGEVREVGKFALIRVLNSELYPANSDIEGPATAFNLPSFHGYEVRMCVEESGVGGSNVADTCGPWARVWTAQATALPTNPEPTFGPAGVPNFTETRKAVAGTFTATLDAPREAGRMFLERDVSGDIRRDQMGTDVTDGAFTGTLTQSTTKIFTVGPSGPGSIRHRVCWEPVFVAPRIIHLL